jgi:hypothetical protein
MQIWCASGNDMSGVAIEGADAGDGPATLSGAGADSPEGELRTGRKPAAHLRVVSEGEPDVAGEMTAEAVSADAPVRSGAAIRAARENLGLELEQVSRETRIHINHLRAIEDMTPNLLGAPVYAKGYIRNYARYLRLDPEATLAQYLRECAILADPQKQEIAPTAAKPPGKRPRGPVLALVAAGLVIGGGVAWVLTSPRRVAPPAAEVPAGAPVTGAAAPATAQAGPALKLVAVSRARIEVRGADGTKFLARSFSPGESYNPRVGAGWTVTTPDGAAFEWRLGDVSLGLLAPEGGPVYAQSVDLALARQPVLTEAPPEALAPAPGPAPGAAPTRAAPREATRTAAPPPAASPPDIGAPASAPPAAGAAPEEIDPSLLAYPTTPPQ